MKRILFLIVLLCFITALGIGSILFMHGRLRPSAVVQRTAVATPTAFLFPTDTPAPTPEQKITFSPTVFPTVTFSPIDRITRLDRRALRVFVQNGSGQFGAATKASEALQVLGYYVIGIADAQQNYDQTVISVKEGKSSYLPLLQRDLKDLYTIGSSSATLSASNSADALVIIGRE